jgi:hypothetical protein
MAFDMSTRCRSMAGGDIQVLRKRSYCHSSVLKDVSSPTLLRKHISSHPRSIGTPLPILHEDSMVLSASVGSNVIKIINALGPLKAGECQ